MNAITPDIKPEYIICAAIHYDNRVPYQCQPVNINSGFVVAGFRHENCINTTHLLLQKMYKCNSTKQGFLTSKNKFLDRQEAWILAIEAKQIQPNEKANTLFSEDLY